MCSSLWFTRVSYYLGDIGSREINSLRFYPQHLLHSSARTTVPPTELSKLHEPVVESLVSSWRATVHEIWSSQPLNLSVKAACSVTFVVTLHARKCRQLVECVSLPKASSRAVGNKLISVSIVALNETINPKVLIKHLWMCHRSSAAISQKLRGNCFIDKNDSVCGGEKFLWLF